MSNPLSRLLVAAASALLLAPPPDALAQTGEPAGSATPDQGAAGAEAGTTATGEGPAAQQPLPTAPATPPPSLTPPGESYYGAPAATPGETAGPAEGTTGTPPATGTTGETPAAGATGAAGATEPNPAEALLAASHEAHEDQAAEHEAEQVSWQEEASRYIELKGYFRTRPQLFYQLNLGRHGVGTNAATPFPEPYDNGVNQNGAPCSGTAGETCFNNNTIAGANMRLRLEPVIHLSSYVQVYATINLLDNLVLGSTPEGYANTPSHNGGYTTGSMDPWVPLTAFATTQVPPVSGVNSFKDSATVKRAWAEVTTPIGRLMFGRMQSQWGLGLLANGGNDIDSDYGDLADRIMWAARYEGIVGALGFDFAGEGPTSQLVFQSQGQPWDLGQLDDVNQYIAVLGYRPTEEEQLARLRNGLPAVAGGLYYVFRNQVLSSESTAALGNPSPTLIQRDAWAHIFDAWFQFRMERFRAETEWVVIYGGIKNTQVDCTRTTRTTSSSSAASSSSSTPCSASRPSAPTACASASRAATRRAIPTRKGCRRSRGRCRSSTGAVGGSGCPGTTPCPSSRSTPRTPWT